MLIYLIRHGESETNRELRHSGWLQCNLTEKGRIQARRLTGRLAGVSFDRIITSDLVRAIQTKEEVYPGLPYTASPLLRERNVGSLAGRRFADCEAEFGQPYLDNKKKGDFTVYGGEDNEMLSDRARRFLEEMEKANDGTVAVFAHEGFLRAAVSRVLGAVPRKGTLVLDNCAIVILELRDGSWRIRGIENE